MTRYVALLRAINVGGRVVKMDRLRVIVERIGVANVSTFIASGNVLFESRTSREQLEAMIEAALRTDLGFQVTTIVRAMAEMSAVVSHVEKNALTPGHGVVLYVGFLKSAASPQAAKAVAALSNNIDTLTVHKRELYWLSRKTLSQSTVTGARLEQILGVPMTIRNFTTVRKLSERAGQRTS